MEESTRWGCPQNMTVLFPPAWPRVSAHHIPVECVNGPIEGPATATDWLCDVGSVFRPLCLSVPICKGRRWTGQSQLFLAALDPGLYYPGCMPPPPNPKWKECSGSHWRLQKWPLLLGVEDDKHRNHRLDWGGEGVAERGPSGWARALLPGGRWHLPSGRCCRTMLLSRWECVWNETTVG